VQIAELNSFSEQALNNFVYIVGPARGGTTIFRDSVGIHDQVLTLPGLTHFMNQVWRYRNKIHGRLLNQVFRLPGFYDEQDVLESLDEQKRKFLQQHIKSTLAKKDLRLMWQLYPLIYSLDKANTKETKNIACWVDKSNDCYGLETILKYFPYAKFVFIFRDPRASVLSLSKRRLVKDNADGNSQWSIGIIESCIYWRNMAQKMLSFCKRHPDNIHKVTFEDFITSSPETLNSVFKFINVQEFSREIIQRKLSEMRYGATNDPEDVGRGISKKPLERWKTALTKQDLSLIAELTGPTARKLGYDIPKPSHANGITGLMKNIPGTKRRTVIALKTAYLTFFELFV